MNAKLSNFSEFVLFLTTLAACVKSILVIDITGPLSLPCVTEHKVYY